MIYKTFLSPNSRKLSPALLSLELGAWSMTRKSNIQIGDKAEAISICLFGKWRAQSIGHPQLIPSSQHQLDDKAFALQGLKTRHLTESLD
jgi:hypothetical protein